MNFICAIFISLSLLFSNSNLIDRENIKVLEAHKSSKVDDCDDKWKVTYKEVTVLLGGWVPVTFETTECKEGGEFSCPLKDCDDDG